eukprot:gnl/MRDRNA2_/MRDRNA2_74607_c0_seq1.p1 gnl/MRDRNA2_/MRDRNA2_74607_c0~~gnl/MRDRNA2_/MRDRNA2_74607_c0_seq1.p1  ORF type:complete len:531 (+),score=79.93 gnl/MRDRNA2_/MRDRNA2_74607_c0_seq1:34-1626(+)
MYWEVVLLEARDVLQHPEKRSRHDEFEVFVRDQIRNGAQSMELAKKRPTSQSSTRAGGGESERAVDGNSDAEWAGQSCTHTFATGERHPWWQVDIGQVKPIGRVRLRNRKEASERLDRWQVRVGMEVNPWRNAPCGQERGTVGSQEWVEVDCEGRQGSHVGVVIHSDKGILTLCEVEVFEQLSGETGGAEAKAARHYIEEYYAIRNSPWAEERNVYLHHAAALYAARMEQKGESWSMQSLEQFYQDIVELRGPEGQLVASTAPFLTLRSRMLEQIGFSDECLKYGGDLGAQFESKCCGPSLTQTAVGCLSKALAFAKMSGDIDHAADLFERAVAVHVGRTPLAKWTSLWQTCEIFVPGLHGGGSYSAFWDRRDPGLGALVKLLEDATGVLESDLNRILSEPGSFTSVFPALVSDGAWERLLLYDGSHGWDEKWCMPGRPLLRICDLLRGQLLGEAAQLTPYYFLSNNEEVSFSRLLPTRTHLRLHSGGTNTRVNIDIAIRGGAGATTTIRLGNEAKRSWSLGQALIYDDC